LNYARGFQSLKVEVQTIPALWTAVHSTSLPSFCGGNVYLALLAADHDGVDCIAKYLSINVVKVMVVPLDSV